LLVRDGDVPVAVPWGRLRVLLAALAMEAGKPVAADALADVVPSAPTAPPSPPANSVPASRYGRTPHYRARDSRKAFRKVG
jgi:hypothetical protein